MRFFGRSHHSRGGEGKGQQRISHHQCLSHYLRLTLQRPTDGDSKVKIADLVEALSQRAESDEDQYTDDVRDDDAPCCPHCGSARTRLLAEWPRFSVP